MKTLALIAFALIQLLLMSGCGKPSNELLTHEVNNPLVEGGRWSTLHEAVHKGNKIRVLELLGKGLDVNVRSAAKNDYGLTPLFLACQKGDLDLAQMLLDRGADVNLGKTTGSSPLHISVENGHRALVELLLARGTLTEVESLFVKKPLEIAREKGLKDIAELLESAIKSKAEKAKP